MSTIFRFTALSDENDNFVRAYEVASEMKLIDFHNFICNDLKYDSNQIVSFFTADLLWEKLHEYTLMDMGVPDLPDAVPSSPMEGVALAQVSGKLHERLIYLFDVFGDRALFMELTDSYPARDGATYPHCALSQGEAPDQFDASVTADESEGGSIFDDVMADFNNFEGDDAYEDD